MLAAYEKIGTDLNASLDALIAKLKQAESQLVALEDTLFDANVEAKLQEKATEIEANLNAAKDGFFAEFENAHAEDLAAIEQALLSKKQQLKSEMAAEK
jgi:predicted  nucleic acid-binding Zn-ribbon protein